MNGGLFGSWRGIAVVLGVLAVVRITIGGW